MSETETKIGKLIPANLIDNDVERTAEAWCKNAGYKMSDYYDSWVECLCDNGYNKFHYYDGTLWVIHLEQIKEYEDIDYMERTDSGFNFVFQYYNGGRCLAEALDDALENAGDC